MKQLSAPFREHLNGECITLCNCWRITRKDGVRLGFTDHDRNLDFDDTTFEAASGLEASQMESSIALTPDNQEVLGALQSDCIADSDITAGRYDNARIEHFIVNWSDPDERLHMQTFLLSDITRADGVFRAELRSLSTVLDQTNMRRFERRCSADFGDAKCGIDAESLFTSSATVSQAIGRDTLRLAGLESFDDHWFSGGKIEFVSGANNGRSVEIIDHRKIGFETAVLCELTLWQPVSADIQPGDAVKVRAGCDKRFSTCRHKYSNSLNFRGFPHMPGSDFATGYAANSENMDGGPLYP